MTMLPPPDPTDNATRRSWIGLAAKLGSRAKRRGAPAPIHFGRNDPNRGCMWLDSDLDDLEADTREACDRARTLGVISTED